jgi:hypothetical protein
MEEKRRTSRKRTLKGARIVLANNTSTFYCVVRNMSESGASLELPSTFVLPAEFRLVFDEAAPPRWCKVIWKKPTRVGVQFVDP